MALVNNCYFNSSPLRAQEKSLNWIACCPGFLSDKVKSCQLDWFFPQQSTQGTFSFLLPLGCWCFSQCVSEGQTLSTVDVGNAAALMDCRALLCCFSGKFLPTCIWCLQELQGLERSERFPFVLNCIITKESLNGLGWIMSHFISFPLKHPAGNLVLGPWALLSSTQSKQNPGIVNQIL